MPPAAALRFAMRLAFSVTVSREAAGIGAWRADSPARDAADINCLGNVGLGRACRR